MKIIFISSNPTFGGATTANLNICKALASLGNDVYFNDEFTEPTHLDTVHYLKIKIHWRSNPIKSDVANWIEKENPDLILWGLSILTPFYYFQIRHFKNIGIKQGVIFHSLSFLETIKGRISDFFTSVAIRNVNYLIFVSEYTQKSWNKYYFFRRSIDKEMVIYNPILEPLGINEKVLPDNLRVGFVGRISEEKQPEIFCELSKTLPYVFHFYGGGEQLNEYKSKYPKVVFHGLESNIETIYSNIDVLILTSRIENCPMVILEAMARGIPVVAPSVGGIPELINVGEDGFMFTNINEISDMVDNIRIKYDFFSLNCRKKASNFYLSNVAERWNSLVLSNLS